MAASDKNILISPQRGSTTQVPSIVFTGDGNDPITLRVLDGVPGSLSFEGSAGQLFSLTNNLTSGSIFSVNDVSGLPSLDVNASGAIQIAPLGGTVAIGQSTVTAGQTVDIKGNLRVDGTLTITSTANIANLNADLLDGLNSTQFLRSDTSGTLSGALTLSHSSGQLILDNSAQADPRWALYSWTGGLNIYPIDAASTIFIGRDGQATTVDLFNVSNVAVAGTNILNSSRQLSNVTFGGNTIWHAGNDGAGSGLDADLLDGLNQTSANTASTIVSRDSSGNFSAGTITATLTGNSSAVTSFDTRSTNPNPQDYSPRITFDFKTNSVNGLSDGGTYNGVMSWRKYGTSTDFSGGPMLQLAYADSGSLWTRLSTGNTTWGAWSRVWNSVNDGSGSGLDADLLDGKNTGTSGNTIPLLDGANTWSSSQTIGRDVYVSGQTGGSFGNRLVVGNTSTSFTLQDTNIRPTIQVHGAYPVVSLNHTITSNGSHGPTLQFTSNGTGSQFVIGTNGTGTFLSMGHSTASDWNPHNGIAGYNGTSFFHADTTGYIGLGSGGDWGPSGGGSPGYNLHFVGSNNAASGHAAYFDNRVSATNNGAGFLFRNQYGDHSWGIVSEYRVEGSAGSDRPSILFSSGYNTTTWSVGYGFSDDNFRIKTGHGHRNGGWGTTRFSINSSGALFAGELTNTIWHAGNDGSGSGLDADLLDGIQATGLFNNMGNVHGTRSAFDATTPSYDFGFRYVQGSGNGPGTGGGQYYSWYIGLGSDYPATGGGSYGAMFAVDRNTTSPYLSVRYNENNSFGTWRRISAGFADSASSATFLNSSNYINRTGSSGNLNTDFQNTPAGSTRIQGDDANLSNSPGGTWWFYQNMRHSNASSFWGTQVAWGWEDQANRLRTRNVQNNNFGGWVNYWNDANDGSGSGLDSDLLDGFNSDRFLRSLGHPGYGSWNDFGNNQQTVYEIYQENFNAGTNTGSSGFPSNRAYSYGTLVSFGANSSARAQIYISHAGNDLVFRGGWGTGSWQTWNRVWTDITDGSGSGLDADLLDGINSGSFARVDSLSIFTVPTYFQSNLGATSGSLNSPPLQAYSTGNNSAFMSFHKGGHYAVNFGLDSDNVLRIGGWSASANRWQLDMSGNMVAAGNVTAYSDIRLKKDIRPIENALDKVMSIRGVTFTRTDHEENRRHCGVIAQEVEEVLPEVIQEQADGIKSVAYGNMVGLLIEAIKEQQNQIESLKAEIENLKGGN